MIQGNDNMGKGLHCKHTYGREMAQLLDDAFAHWSRADVAAEYHSYENEEANDRADARWARYEQLKAQALQIRYAYEIEVVPVYEEVA